MAGIPGKTAPRLLQDLLSYDARFEDRAKRNLLASPPPLWDPDAEPTAAVPRRNCRHAFLFKEEQSRLPGPREEPGLDTVYQLAAYCSRCRYHFLLQIDYHGHGQRTAICRTHSREFPLHHFLFHGEGGHGTFAFACSAPQCPAALTIQVTPPRLTDDDVLTLTDRAVLRRRWDAAKLLAGERADTTMARPVDAPDFLNTYLQDCLNPQKGKARIPLLNRKFLKTFGRDCDAILKKVGFTSAVEDDDDGIPAHVWYLPKPEEPTERHMIQDVRYELNTIILSYPEQERLGARHVPLNPPSARNLMERVLGCEDYPKVKGRTLTRSTNHEEDHPYYAGLGAVGDFADELLLFAYQRQMAVDEANAPYYFECLQDLAVGRQSESLQGEVAILASQGCFKRSEVALAYRYFDMNPAHAHMIKDEHITGVFKSRLSDISPATAEESRRQLRIIGHARGSNNIIQVASDTIESYEQALSWLDMDKDHVDDFVPTMYATKVSDNPANRDVARKAVEMIAEYRNSPRLRYFLEHGSMEAAAMDEGEAYATLEISDRTVQLDSDLLESQVQLLIESNPTNVARLQEACAKVRQDQESRFGKSYVPNPTVNYPVETWPVGCCNIGNTCYLNSVLQFLFTVKPLRDLVLNCDDNLQELTPEALEKKRVGRMAVSLARAETGQQFVRELRKLFERMITAPTHNIRPDRTLAALALTRGEGTDNMRIEEGTAHTGLGDIGGLPISGPMLPTTKVDSAVSDSDDNRITGGEDNGHNDDAKSDTSTTPMDLTVSSNNVDGAAATMPKAPSRAPPVPPRPKASADQGFKKVEEVARQQDAAEILNNVFDLLSCAFQGKSTLEDGEQRDLIKDLFFSKVTTVRVNNGNMAPKSDLQDNILISTKDRERTLCAALDDEFGLTELDEGDVSKFELFQQAAPILEFNVRRLQFENDRPRKDESHLALEKVLYLDRYLEKTDSLSAEQLQALRDEQWGLQKELRQMEDHRRALKETDFKDLNLPSVLEETAAYITKADHEWADLSESAKTEADGLASHLDQRAAELRPDILELDSRMKKLEHDIDTVFENCRDHPYHLHAIFIHAGSASGGHYWIYIYDFQNDIWRSYNDETVKQETEDTVFQKVNRVHPPTSTGIVYVRADVVREYTQAVCRNPEPKDVPMKDVDADARQEIKTDTGYENLPVLDGVPTE